MQTTQPRKSSPAGALCRNGDWRRRGAILVLAAFLLVMIFAFLAFTVDTGFITLTKSQLQAAADSSALGAGGEFAAGLGVGGTSATAIDANARSVAGTLASAHRAGDVPAIYVDQTRDVRLGQYQWDATSNSWVKSWGTTPYNLVEVTLHRDQGFNAQNGDRSLPLFFAPLIGHQSADLDVKSAVAVAPGVGFRIEQGSSSTFGALPITVDLGTWNTYIAGNSGTDSYKYTSSTGAVTTGTDGIKELNIYPEGSSNLPPGNRGTVDLGSPNNSTADLVRQIRYGLNATDLSYFPNNEIRTDNGPIPINGDTGISAGIKDDLAAIIGQPRAMPIFTTVSGPGNNATYTVVKFVGVRIVYVKLTGSPSQKKVLIQPAPFASPQVIPGKVTITTDSIFSKPRIVN